MCWGGPGPAEGGSLGEGRPGAAARLGTADAGALRCAEAQAAGRSSPPPRRPAAFWPSSLSLRRLVALRPRQPAACGCLAPQPVSRSCLAGFMCMHMCGLGLVTLSVPQGSSLIG